MRVRFIVRSLAILFAGAFGLHAQTDVWLPTSGNWGTPGNWSNGVPTSGDNVVFSNSSPNTSTVDASYTITYFTISGPGPFTLNSTGGAVLTINSATASSFGSTSSAAINVAIAGTGNFWLNGGTGTVTLNPGGGANTYSGSTQVFAGGTLADGEANSFSPNSSLYVGGATPSTVDVNFNESVASLGDVAGGPGSVVIASGATLFFTGGFTSSFSGVISGAGGIEMDNVGTFILTNANTYTGTTVTATGTGIQLGNGGTTGSIASNSVSGGGSLSFDRSNTYTYAGALTGALNVVQQGTGTTVLAGVNTYTGPTTLNGGILQAGSPTAFGNDSSFILNGARLDLNNFSDSIGSLAGTVGSSVTLGSGTLTVNNIFSGATTFFGVISGAGGSLVMAGNVLDLTNSNTYSGGTTVNAGTLLADNAAGSATGTGPITIGPGGALLLGQADAKGSVSAASAITDNGQLQFFRSDVITFPNTISGIGGIDLDGAGTVMLSGTNTYSGTTNIQNAGTLQAGSTSAFGGATGLSPVTFAGNGTIDLNGFSNTIGSLNGSGASFILLGSSTLTVGAGNGNYSGVISGLGGSMVFAGNSQILTGANTYSGNTNITNGTLLVANSSGSGTGSSAINISPGAILAIGANSTAGSVAAATIVDNGTVNFARTDNTTIPSIISGTGGIHLVATGTVTLTGTNAFSGTTLIDAGTLADGVSSAFSPLSNVQLSSGASLQLNNTEIVGNISNGTGSGSVVIGTGASLTSLGASYSSDFLGNISGMGSFTLANGVQGLGGNNTYQGGTIITGNGEIFVSSNTAFGTGIVTFAGSNTELSPDNMSVTLANPFILDSVLDNDDGGAYGLTLSGAISGTSGITWCTSGVLALLNASNTFQGGIDMREGTLLLGGNTSAGTGGITLDSGTVLSAFGSGVTLNVPNDLNVTGPTQIGNFDNNFITLSGTMSGEVNSVTYSGGTNGTLTITGNNSGLSLDTGFIINSGTVVAANSSAFGSSGNYVLMNGGAGLNVMNGITVNNPLQFSGSANVLSGNGTIGAPVTIDSTVVVSPSASPGNGPGTLSFNSPLTLATGGTIAFKLYDANGSPGTGFSLIGANSGLNITAGAGSVAFNLFSTDINGNPAAAINFNPASSYSWAFVLATPSITGFNSNQFNLNTAGFTNGTGGGTFNITGNTNELMLNFTPVPEPSTWALIASSLVAFAPFALRRRRTSRS